MAAKMSFEDALAKLEETVHKLETGGLPLEQTVALFEEGTRLASSATSGSITQICGSARLVQAPDGSVTERPLRVAMTNAPATQQKTPNMHRSHGEPF